MTDNRKDALTSALSMIEKQFGAGSVMKLGEKTHMKVETCWSGSIALGDALSRSMGQNHQEKQRLHFMQLQNVRKLEVQLRLWMLSTHLILHTQRLSE